MFFQVSFVTSLVMVIGFTLILKNWRTKTRIHSRAVFFFLFLAVVGILFTNSTTLFVWENIDLMKFIQFPSRFLSLTNLATAFLAGILVWPELQKSYRWIYKKIRPKATYGLTGATIVILILLIWFFSPFLKPSGGYLPKKPDQRYAPHYLIHDQLMASNTINTFVYKTAIFPKYNNIDKLEERVDKVVDDINYALWHDLEYRYQKTEILEGQAEIGLVFEKSNQRKLKINASTDVIMIVNTFWFPGWQAKLNGQPVDIIVNDDFGLMEFNIPMGSHELVLEFKNTPIRTASNAISLISIIILFGVGAYAKLRRNKQSESFYHTQR
ncbi:hypothetical protein KJ782_01640 [Patescibacteria group bacterium]|nr:hypothetical protein [Patescibacteria group bacterium]